MRLFRRVLILAFSLILVSGFGVQPAEAAITYKDCTFAYPAGGGTNKTCITIRFGDQQDGQGTHTYWVEFENTNPQWMDHTDVVGFTLFNDEGQAKYGPAHLEYGAVGVHVDPPWPTAYNVNTNCGTWQFIFQPHTEGTPDPGRFVRNYPVCESADV